MQMKLGEFVTRAKELGAETVSLEAAFFPSQDKTYLLELKSTIQGLGMDCILSWGHPDGLERGLNAESFNQMIALIPQAQALGASIMRIVVSNHVWRNEDTKEQIDRVVPWLKEAAKAAADNNVKLAIENNMDFTGEEMQRLIETVDSPQVGIAFDSGNFLRLLDDPVHAAELLTEHILSVELKDVQANPKEARPTDWDFFACVPVGQGLANNQAIVNILARAGYDGTVAVQVDQPHTEWFGRENEIVVLSLRSIREFINYAG